jgi:hypothetical protein
MPPKFTGTEEFADWLKRFDTVMVMLSLDENKPKMTKLFRNAIVEGSIAAAWYDDLPDDTKAQWDTLIAAAKLRSDDFNKQQARRAIFDHRLPDDQIGSKDSGSKDEKQVIWVTKW